MSDLHVAVPCSEVNLNIIQALETTSPPISIWTDFCLPEWASMEWLPFPRSVVRNRCLRSSSDSRIVCMSAARFLVSRRDERTRETFVRTLLRKLQERLGAKSILVISSYWLPFWPNTELPKRTIVLQNHPHPLFLLRLYRDLKSRGGAYSTIDDEYECRLGENVVQKWDHLLASADLFITNCQFARDSVVSCGASPDRVKVIPLGVDLVTFNVGQCDDQGAPRFLYLGSRSARKGFDLVKEAWARWGPSESSLYVVGRHAYVTADGGKDRADRITMLGSLSERELVKVLQSTDYLVAPSVAEGFGLAIVEAMACGVHVIGTANSVLGDWSPDPGAFTIVDASSAASLGLAIKDRSTAGRLAHDQRTRIRAVVGDLSWNTVRHTYKQVLKEYIDSKCEL